ncbi:hypothetical protein FB440_102170 [Vibrio crassostreae]|nr:hypothetical protein EDB56_10423 [Vibrio crassostreae]ROO65503.1 hypothetical protein EDB58_101287 [Vibrio crassostreae]ROO69535.1 hypothetical protein EDB57_3205 [Vibrio crassostreae]ROO70528.1 hypothetical protein EDB64_3035 [Vibrio crassostreae]ROO71076.1 hypothetical protein EDB53_3200 [Vibrio crassostreae]
MLAFLLSEILNPHAMFKLPRMLSSQ